MLPAYGRQIDYSLIKVKKGKLIKSCERLNYYPLPYLMLIMQYTLSFLVLIFVYVIAAALGKKSMIPYVNFHWKTPFLQSATNQFICCFKILPYPTRIMISNKASYWENKMVK